MFAKRAHSNQLVGFIIIFDVLVKNRISSEYVPMMKVLIFADMVY